MDDLHAIRIALEALADEVRLLRVVLTQSQAVVPAGSDTPSTSSLRLLTAKELAALLGTHVNFVYTESAAGRLPSYKVGGSRRFKLSEIETFLNQRKTRGS